MTPNDPKAGAKFSGEIVTGEIFKDNKVSCTFSAVNGEGDRDSEILTLTNRVRVVSKAPACTVTCDKLIYYGDKKFFKAIGNVHVLGTMGSVGTIDEVWATADFQRIATPDMFNQR